MNLQKLLWLITMCSAIFCCSPDKEDITGADSPDLNQYEDFKRELENTWLSISRRLPANKEKAITIMIDKKSMEDFTSEMKKDYIKLSVCILNLRDKMDKNDLNEYLNEQFISNSNILATPCADEHAFAFKMTVKMYEACLDSPNVSRQSCSNYFMSNLDAIDKAYFECLDKNYPDQR